MAKKKFPGKGEIEKIKNIQGLSAKLEYIWEYYWIWIVGVIGAIFFIVFAINQYTGTIKDYWFYITFTNTSEDIGTGSKLWEDYVEYAGFDLKEKNVEFNNNSFFDYGKSVIGNSYFEAFISYTDAGTLDAVTMEPDSLIALGASGCLLDLESEECASIREKYGDRFLYCEPFDEEYGDEPVAIGIDISDSVLMERYHLYANGCALGIGSKSGNIESVERFLDFVFEEE